MSEVISFRAAHNCPRGAVSLTTGTIGLHAGISYRTTDEVCRVLHLAWHYVLTVTDDIEQWAYVVPRLDLMEQQILAGICDLVATTRPRVPYGFQ